MRLALMWALALAACGESPSPTMPTVGVPADFRIKFELGQCFGRCPVYWFTASADGSVVYFGELYVQARGYQTGTLSAPQVQGLVEAIETAGFYGLSDRYVWTVTDAAFAETTVTMNGRTKSVFHYPAGECETDMFDIPPEFGTLAPARLCALEAQLERIPVGFGWVSDR